MTSALGTVCILPRKTALRCGKEGNIMSETIISMQGITKSYGKHQVLHDVNLDIQ